jgi:hypothetical protein
MKSLLRHYLYHDLTTVDRGKNVVAISGKPY